MRVFNLNRDGAVYVSEKTPKTDKSEKRTMKIIGWTITGAVAALAIIFGGTVGIAVVGFLALIKVCADI